MIYTNIGCKKKYKWEYIEKNYKINNIIKTITYDGLQVNSTSSAIVLALPYYQQIKPASSLRHRMQIKHCIGNFGH